MAGIGDSWGTKEELLHPRGPDGRWIHKAGIAKSIIGAVLDFLANFRPRTFQSRGQSAQYLHNIAQRQGRLRMGRTDQLRLRHDLPHANADLRDGVIDEPSTKRFVDMMDRSATELPDDAILTRVVGVDSFGFTPETASGTDADNPGIRGMSGKLIADRGYSLTTIGGVQGQAPQGSVRMVIAAKKGTKVVVPAANPNDTTVFLDRGQPYRVTKVAPDGAGGWTMYVTAERHEGRKVPEPIGGPVGEGRKPSKDREARIRQASQEIGRAEGLPDEEKLRQQEEANRQAREQMGPPTPSPAQEAERRRVEALPRQPAPGEPPPRTEPVVGRVGEAPGAGPAPVTPAPGITPEATPVPRRTVDIRRAVADADLPTPSEGPQRREWNNAYLGLKSGKLEPDEAARQLDADIQSNRRRLADLRSREGNEVQADDLESNIQAQEAFRDLIREQYDLPQPGRAPAKKAAPEKRTEAGLPKVTKQNVQTRRSKRELEAEERNKVAAAAEKKAAGKKAPTKKAAAEKKTESGFTEAQERAIVDRAKQFRGKERNEEETRIVQQADDIQARRRGETPTPAKAPAAKATKAPAAKKALPPVAKKAPAKKAAAKKVAPEAPGDDLDKMTKAELLAEAERRDVVVPKSWTKDKIKALIREEEFRRPRKKTPEQRREQARRDNELLREMEALEQARDAGDLDKMSKAQLLALARREGVQRASSMNKDQLKTGIRRMREIGPVEPGSIIGRENRVQEIMGLDKKPTVAQLRAFAKERGISVGSRDSRVRLMDAILGEGPGAPEAPAPVKKAAKAAVPEAAPEALDTKNLKIGQGVSATRIKPGDVVWVEPGKLADGTPTFLRTRKKTGSLPLTVTRNERESGNNYILHGTLPDGREVSTAGYFGQNTFYRVDGLPESGVPTPAKKAVKKAAPSLLERMASGEGPSGHPGDTGAAWLMVPEEQERQVKLDRARAYGTLGPEVDELVTNGASPRALASRLRSRAKRENIPDEDMAPLLQAAEAGDNDRVRELARGLMEREGIRQIHSTDEIVALDRKNHTSLTGEGLPRDTSVVRVVRPGSRATVDGQDILVNRAIVDPASPDEVRQFQRARQVVPEGSVSGTRTDVPVDNPARRKDLRKAMLDADLSPASPGSARKAQEEIKGDLIQGRITPEEAIRRHESEVEFLTEDANEVDANLRQTDLTDAERTKLTRQHELLQASIDSNKRHSEFLRQHFRDEAPVVSLEEMKDVDPVSYEFLKGATPDDMREAAKQAGLDPPEGDTPDEMFQDLLKQVVKNELARRAAKKAAKAAKKAPAKKAAKKAVPEVPKERERIDARLVGAGLDFDENDPWVKRILDDTQKELDAGNETPAAIGRRLDESGTLRMTTAVYEHGSWLGEDRPWQTPEESAKIKADNQKEYDRVKAEVEKIRELGKRLQATRRRPVKKAAPEAPKEIRTRDQQIDDLQKRIIDNALSEIHGAKSRDKADDALEGLTMPELRRLADASGIEVKGRRSKRALRDAILDHFKGGSEPEPPTPGGPSGQPRTLGVRARDAGIQHPGQTFSDVDSAIGEADRRLQGGESPTTVARFLRERAARVSKADLNEEGRRFPVEYDKDSLLSMRRQSAEYLRRVATHVQQEGKATRPTKKAAPSMPEPAGTVRAEGYSSAANTQLRVVADGKGGYIGQRQLRSNGSWHDDPSLGTGNTPRDITSRQPRGQWRMVAPPAKKAAPAPAKKAAKKAEPPKRDLGAEVRTLTRGTSSGERAGKPEGAPLRENLTTRETKDSNGRIIRRDRPKADEPVHLPNGGADQGRLHMDGEIGKLWETLYFDDREPNSFVNEIARIGEQVGTGELPLSQALTRLARMKEQATDQRVSDRIQRAIDGLDAPPVRVPDLPDTVPASIREALRRLADIPTARRKDLPGTRDRGSVFEQKLDIVRRLDAGDEDRTLHMKFYNRDLHESIDGVLEMRRLIERIDRVELARWRREAYRRAHPEQYSAFDLVPV